MLTIASDTVVAVVKYPFWGEVISLLLILCFFIELRILILKLISLVSYMRGGEIMGKEKNKDAKAVAPTKETKAEAKKEVAKPSFKAGNRVRVKSTNSKNTKSYSGKEGTVVSVDNGDFPVKVKFGQEVGKAKKVYGFKAEELE